MFLSRNIVTLILMSICFVDRSSRPLTSCPCRAGVFQWCGLNGDCFADIRNVIWACSFYSGMFRYDVRSSFREYMPGSNLLIRLNVLHILGWEPRLMPYWYTPALCLLWQPFWSQISAIIILACRHYHVLLIPVTTDYRVHSPNPCGQSCF